MIFGTSIPKATGHQMAIQFRTSPYICFYTTLGKQNKRNMPWNAVLGFCRQKPVFAGHAV